MNGICKLCEKEKGLNYSHIIPEFFYDRIYDLNPRKFWYIKLNTGLLFKKKEQKGLREYLLCTECENEFSLYEKYAAEIIYAKNRRSPVVLKRKSRNEHITVNEYSGFEYNTFKLFLLSILWRIAISTDKFNIVNISEEHKAKLHLALKNKKPLDENEYPCCIQFILNNDNKLFGGTIVGPYETQYNGLEIINLLVDGHLFNFILGSIDLNSEIQKIMLNRKGEMSILTKKVQSDSNIMDAINRFTREFGDLYKK